MWSGQDLYLFIDVTDPNIITNATDPWDQDSVEIFLDENHQRTPFTSMMMRSSELVQIMWLLLQAVLLQDVSKVL